MVASDSWYTSLTKPFGGVVDTGTGSCGRPFDPQFFLNQAPERGAVPIILGAGGLLSFFVNQAPDRGAVPIILEGATPLGGILILLIYSISYCL